MLVFLDEESVDVGCETLAGALEAARVEAERRGRVLVEVLVDGEAVSEAVLEHPTETATPDAEVRLTSADPVALVGASLREAADELEASAGLHEEAARFLQTGELEDAMEGLGCAIGAWDGAQRAVVHGSALLGRAPEGITTSGGTSMDTRISELLGQLQQMKTSIETQDWSEVADLLEFELGPRTGDWAILLRELATDLPSSQTI